MTSSPRGSARSQSEELLERIRTIDPLTNAVCTVHPHALTQADRLDEEAAAGTVRSPLHGRAVLVKDNIDTHDLPTTAGSLALADAPPPTADATLVQRLRAAGMVVLGKTNLSEWANIRDEASTSGWSAYGGLTRNPYGLNRSAGGSSSGSGSAVAAGLAPYAIGTETDGSISCPAAFNGCVGIKPTVGTVPTAGVVPVSRSQDSPGPMARTVADAAALLTVMAANGIEYAEHAVPGRLAGKRIGVPRATYWGYSPHADAAAERALGLLAAEGATIVDNTDLPPLADEVWADEMVVLLAEFRAGVADYLATRSGAVPRTLDEIVDFNRKHASTELAHFGQGLFEDALAGPTQGSPEHRAARQRGLEAARKGGIDRVLREHALDALVTPSYPPAHPIDLVNAESLAGACTGPTAIAGYPLVTVPTELAAGLPVAVSWWGPAGSETHLIEIAHGYEAARDRSSGPLAAPTFPGFL
ncbi:MAG: Amidase [Nocardioides sp.]|jgi:amidase|uniref:amidase family protein n=1 Tax=Nocardioides sp. TaxID=35761 RepID=UPI00260BA563|nr:amidase family protein [Nocardioides sp.]MCW2833031.1 Amidase [Nocardioides sp.]